MKLSTFCGYCQFWTIIFHFSSAVIVDQGIFNHLTVQIGEDVQQPTQCEVFFGNIEVRIQSYLYTPVALCLVMVTNH